jgi:hypothetical protein
MLEVGIFTRIHAAGAEPELTLLFVHLHDMADRPGALGDLPGGAGRTVDQVQVIPAIAFGHPDGLFAIGQVVAIPLAGLERGGGAVVVEKCLRFLRDHRARRAGLGVNFDHPVDLVAALVVFEREGATVFPPHQLGHVVGIRKQLRVDDELLLAAHVEEYGLLEIEQVPRLGILRRPVLGLELILRRRGDVMHKAAVAGADLIRHDLR